MTRRLFTACLGTETNSFSPIPTGLGLFGRTMLVRDGRFDARPNLFALPLQLWRERARARGWTVIEGLAAFAAPAGDTTRATYEALRAEILAGLRGALPVDAVMLNLHGAMIADGYPDAEGDLLAAVRATVGPAVPIVAELDLHCHLTRLKVDSADALVIFKEYPHIDVRASPPSWSRRSPAGCSRPPRRRLGPGSRRLFERGFFAALALVPLLAASPATLDPFPTATSPPLFPGARSVLWVGAHPDDEVLLAPVLAKLCLLERLDCHLLVLTRGEAGICLLPGGCRNHIVGAAAA